MTSIGQWFSQLDFSVLLELLLTVAAALLCIMLHECAHGIVAYWLGDPTAKQAGRLTLNPIKHIDIVGLIMLAVAKVGWAKAVPVNPNNFKRPKLGMAITALAGPLCNVLLAFVAMIIGATVDLCDQINGGQWLHYVSYFFMYVCTLSCGLAVFNLIPIPPLDGSKVLAMVLPNRAYRVWMRYEHFGMILLIALVFLLPRLLPGASPLSSAIGGLWKGLWMIAKYPVKGIMTLLYPDVPILY